MPPSQPHSRGFVLLVSVFFLSGACGLVYEVVWSRLMFLVFGSTTYAISTVIGIYMLGLALGSYLAGVAMRRLASLAKAYALLELGVGLYAFMFLSVLAGVDALHARIFPYVYENGFLLNAVRVLLSLAALILPTTMMGATLPLLSQYLARSANRIGRDVGLLYCINTIGAAAGCFLSAFVLIPAVGLTTAIYGAGALNVLIGLAVWLFFPAQDAPSDLAGEQASPALETDARVTSRQAVWVLWAFVVSGFLALVFEVAWSRALVLVFGSSVYSFSTMLTTFLCGLALGSVLVARFIDRVKNPVALFCALSGLMGLCVVLTTPLIGQLPELLVRLYKPQESTWTSMMFVQFAMCFAVMFPATFMSGGLFPVVAKIFSLGRRQGVGRTVGEVYAYNTVGGILGSLSAGFLLIPRLGVEKSLLYAGAVCMLLAAAVLAKATRAAAGPKYVGLAGLVLAAIVLPAMAPSWDKHVLNLGVYRNTEKFVQGITLFKEQGGLKALARGTRMLFYRESHAATVAVTQQPDGAKVLIINGKADGSAGSGMDSYTQTLLGMLPLLYSRDPQTALVIGLATGMTFGGTLNFPLKQADCIEISDAVVEASHYFDDYNGRPLERKNSKLHILDGRTWLMAMPNAYDAIICCPSNPWQTGNANLFTLDFYRMARQRLGPNGVFCQWLPIYDVTEEQYRTLLASFKQVFPHVDLWLWMSDTILIGSDRPLSMDYQALQNALNIPAVKTALDQLDIRSIPDLMSFFYLDTDGVAALTAGVTRFNTDHFPLIEFASPKNVHRLLSQDSLLYPICRLTQRAKLPIPASYDSKELRETILQTRLRIYKNIGVPEEVVRGLFSQ